MTFNGIFQILLFFGVLLLLTKPMGIYLTKVYSGEKTFLDFIFKPLERLFYAVTRVDAEKEMNWKQYGIAMVMFSLLSSLAVYAIQRLQFFLPLNPQEFASPSEHSAFNTAVSFVTNTNWQSYAGEMTMSYFTQMTALAVQNFVSAAVGMALAVVFIRGIARFETDKLGNFWTDLVRGVLYVLLPISFLAAIFFMSQGAVQNFKPYDSANLTESFVVQVDKKDDDGNVIKDANDENVKEDQTIRTQTIAQGPAASQLAIKMLGTNGGGFFNTNAAHPFENPTPLTNFLEMLAIVILPASLTHTFGKMINRQRQGWLLFWVMTALFVGGIFFAHLAEQRGNPLIAEAVNQTSVPNLEGKEVRFGIGGSMLAAVTTSNGATGSYNSMLDSFTPIGGLVPLVNMLLGEIIYGGLGTGLYSIIFVALIALFLGGLMIGRKPEYLGKEIGVSEIKLIMIYTLAAPFAILVLTALAVSTESGLAGLTTNDGAYGFTEIFYAYTSSFANNGQNFAGLSANSVFYNLTTAAAMLVGRFGLAIPALALAGAFARQGRRVVTVGTLPTDSFAFGVFLAGTAIIVGALSYFPALALGAILEHLSLFER